MTERDTIIASHFDRLRARNVVKCDVDEAKVELHPQTQINRFVDRQKVAATKAMDLAASRAKANAPYIGILGLGAILILARRPISKWLSKIKTPIKPNNR